MNKSVIPEEISLTPHAVEKKAAKLQRLYMKRVKKHEGRRPDKELFILYAAYSLFKEKYPKKGKIFKELFEWLERNFNQDYKFDWKKLYEWMGRRPFKEMQWEGAWEDLRIAQKISDHGAKEEEMSSREIMRAHAISKQELENLALLVLSHHVGNKKISDKFIFNRSDK